MFRREGGAERGGNRGRFPPVIDYEAFLTFAFNFQYDVAKRHTVER
jgi:hypothetical protein